MRIPRKSGEAVIVLGGRNGAFWFGFWAALGVATAAGAYLTVDKLIAWGFGWLSVWWGA